MQMWLKDMHVVNLFPHRTTPPTESIITVPQTAIIQVLFMYPPNSPTALVFIRVDIILRKVIIGRNRPCIIPIHPRVDVRVMCGQYFSLQFLVQVTTWAWSSCKTVVCQQYMKKTSPIHHKTGTVSTFKCSIHVQYVAHHPLISEGSVMGGHV